MSYVDVSLKETTGATKRRFILSEIRLTFLLDDADHEDDDDDDGDS